MPCKNCGAVLFCVRMEAIGKLVDRDVVSGLSLVVQFGDDNLFALDMLEDVILNTGS